MGYGPSQKSMLQLYTRTSIRISCSGLATPPKIQISSPTTAEPISSRPEGMGLRSSHWSDAASYSRHCEYLTLMRWS